MDKDRVLQRKVLDELEWDPKVDPADIGVSVIDGVVTLHGMVRSYAEKIAAEAAVHRVAGASALAEELHVRLASEAKTADHEIARRILDLFAWNPQIPERTIEVKVEHGRVTLGGTVAWYYQSKEAVEAAAKIGGVTAITNEIRIENTVSAANIQQEIKNALWRQADLDARSVSISVDGDTVTLDGRVHAPFERKVAERAAWTAPGVTKVVDRLTVE